MTTRAVIYTEFTSEICVKPQAPPTHCYLTQLQLPYFHSLSGSRTVHLTTMLLYPNPNGLMHCDNELWSVKSEH